MRPCSLPARPPAPPRTRPVLILIVLLLARAGSVPPVSASVPLELKDGRTFEIIALERAGANITITTDRGVRFPMKLDRIVPPDEAWTRRARALVEEGKLAEALETARLLRIWDPASPDAAALLAEVQSAVYQVQSEAFRRALQAQDFDTVRAMLEEARENEDLQRFYHEAISHALSGRYSSLRAETLDMTLAFLEKVEALGLGLPEEARLRTRLDAMRSERRERTQRVEARQRELQEATVVQNTLTQAMSFSSAGQFERARAVIDELTPELRQHPDVVRTRALVDAQEARGRRTELLADIRQHRRLQHWGAALRLAEDLALRLPEDADLQRERQDAWLDHRRAVGMAKAAQQQGRGTTYTVAARPGLTYQVFLPWSYQGDKALPAIWAYSAAGLGTEMVALFESIANNSGYIIVSPNGPLGTPRELTATQDALVDDLRNRLLLDPRQSVAVGYGAAAGDALALVTRRPDVAPVLIALSSGAPALPGVRAVTRFPIVFVVGQDDPVHFNEVRPATESYRRLSHPVELITFPGKAPVPPTPVLERAMIRAQELSAAAGPAPTSRMR